MNEPWAVLTEAIVANRPDVLTLTTRLESKPFVSVILAEWPMLSVVIYRCPSRRVCNQVLDLLTAPHPGDIRMKIIEFERGLPQVLNSNPEDDVETLDRQGPEVLADCLWNRFGPNHKISAIKRYREVHKSLGIEVGLRDSKEAIDDAMERFGGS